MLSEHRISQHAPLGLKSSWPPNRGENSPREGRVWHEEGQGVWIPLRGTEGSRLSLRKHRRARLCRAMTKRPSVSCAAFMLGPHKAYRATSLDSLSLPVKHRAVTRGRMTDCSFKQLTVVRSWDINIYFLRLMPLSIMGSRTSKLWNPNK